jgi:hypothetical protein
MEALQPAGRGPSSRSSQGSLGQAACGSRLFPVFAEGTPAAFLFFKSFFMDSFQPSMPLFYSINFLIPRGFIHAQDEKLF